MQQNAQQTAPQSQTAPQPQAPDNVATTSADRPLTTVMPVPIQKPVLPANKTLAVTPSLTTTYDDNIYRDPNSVPKTSSIVIAPGVAAAVRENLGVNTVALDATGRYDVYTKDSNRDNFRFDVHGTGTLLIEGSCGISPDLEYRSERSDYGDSSLAVDNRQRLARLGGTVECKRPAGIYPSVQYEHHIGRNDTNFAFANETGDRIRGGLVLAKPSLGEIMAYYAYENVDRDTLGISNRANEVGLRFTRAISSLFSAKIDGGYLDVRSSAASLKPYKGAMWDVELSSRAIPFTLLTLTFSRQMTNDALTASGFTIGTTYGGQAQIGLSSLTSIRLFGNYVERAFRQDPLITRTTLASDSFLVAGAELDRALTGRITAKLSYNYSRRRTADNSNNYETNQVALGLEARF